MKNHSYCHDFDSTLKEALPHLKNYPNLMPFIGNAWEQQNVKILFVGESHYLTKQSNGISNSKTWYSENYLSLPHKDDNGHIFTRGVFNGADRHGIGNNKDFSKGFTIFYNLKKAVFQALNIKNEKQLLFHNFGFYNYFQRPAEVNGGSIKNDGTDNKIAYDTLLAICQHINPLLIFFLSKKAFNSFNSSKQKAENAIFKDIAIYSLPHPGCAWWNKASKSYKIGGKPVSGKCKFIHIIKETNLELIFN